MEEFGRGEYFDRVIRDQDEFCDKLEYILGNPQKRWPEIENYAVGVGH